MKSEDQVRKRLQDLKYRYLQRLLRARLKRRPHNCQFNKEHTITRSGETITMRLCMLGMEREDWNVDICEEPKQAASCPAYLPVMSREELEAEFEAALRDPDTVNTKYRDLIALAWVLGDETLPKYSLLQRFWLAVTSWAYPRKQQVPEIEAHNGDDEDRG